MNANVKRTLAAAIKAAQSVNAASEKLATCTASFIKAAGGFDEAIKLLNEQRADGRTWKTEREEATPLYRVYNAVSVAKSRAKQGQQQQGRAGRAGQQQGQQGDKGDKGQQQGQQAAAAKPATPADIMGVVLSWTPAQIAQAIRDQTAVLESSAIDTLTETLDLLINSTPKAPRKAAPRKRATK